MSEAVEKQLRQFLSGLKERNPHEREFHQAVEEVATSVVPFYLDHAEYRRAQILPRLQGIMHEIHIIFLHKDGFHKRHNRVWEGADLVMEIVGDGRKDHIRVYEEKRAEYAAGGIAEY